MRLFSIQINCKSCLESFRMLDCGKIDYELLYIAIILGKHKIVFNCPYCNNIFEDDEFAIEEICRRAYE